LIQQIIMPPAWERGQIVKLCTGAVCISFKITGRRKLVINVVEAAGSLALDPMVAYYDERIRAGDLPKVARAKACKKYKLSRRRFFQRKAAR
jgi:hypothetical protein